MPETKNNRRVRFTRSALREALIDLILEKPLVSITVKDICARADINRSTFYLHFKDVTDILRTTEDEIIEHMREHTPTHKRKFRICSRKSIKNPSICRRSRGFLSTFWSRSGTIRAS